MVKNPFNELVNTPDFWVLSARRLKRSGDLVFTAYLDDVNSMVNGTSPLELINLELAGVASMLYGLAIENLLKAIIISDDSSSHALDRIKKWPKDGHELILLVEEVGLKLNESQRDLLFRLTSFVRWCGRYPVPKSKDYFFIKQKNINKPFKPIPLNPGEQRMLEQLYNYLLKLITK